MVPVLETRSLCKSFGAVVAAADISVALQAGEVVGVIGPNGAGKTSFVNLVTGYLRPTTGTVRFAGDDITGRPPRTITRLGIARSFQTPQLMDALSALHNVLVALAIAPSARPSLWRPLERPETIEAARDVLRRYGIEDYAGHRAGELPHGVRKLLDIAMAMASEPRLALLDEPTSGVSVEEKFAVMDTLMRALAGSGVTVLFVEHDMEIVQRYASRVLAFYDGRVIADDVPERVMADPEVRACVVGQPAGAEAADASGA